MGLDMLYQGNAGGRYFLVGHSFSSNFSTLQGACDWCIWEHITALDSREK